MWNTLSHSAAQRKRIAKMTGYSWLGSDFLSGTDLQCAQGRDKILEKILLHTAVALFGTGC